MKEVKTQLLRKKGLCSCFWEKLDRGFLVEKTTTGMEYKVRYSRREVGILGLCSLLNPTCSSKST